MIEFWWDGATEPINPGGHGSWGTHIIRDGVVLFSKGGYIGRGPKISNNVCEYSAFIRGLEFLLEQKLNAEQTIGYGDSNLVVSQIYQNADGTRWRVRGGLYVKYYHRAKKLFDQFTNIKLFWISRDENGVCDKLSKDPLIKMNVKFRIQPNDR